MNLETALITPKKSLTASLKRTREKFESQSKLNLEIESKTMNPVIHEQIEQKKSKLIQEKILNNRIQTDKLQKTKNVCERMNLLLENDEKSSDFKTLKTNPQLTNDDYEWFDIDFIHSRSVTFPKIFYECDDSNRKIKGFIQELGIVYYLSGKTLYFWYCFPNILTGSNAQTVLNATLEEEIVNLAFISNDLLFFHVKNLLVLAFKNCDLKFYTLKISEREIKLESIGYPIQTEGEVESITFSKTGRLFYGCQHGLIREIEFREKKLLGISYQKGFYNKKGKDTLFFERLWNYVPLPGYWKYGHKYVKSIVIDDSRYILYALIETGARWEKTEILVYDLGFNNQGFEKILTITSKELREKIIGRYDRNFNYEYSDLKIIQICPLNEGFSKDIHVLLVTQTGLRIFIKLNSTNLLNSLNSNEFLYEYSRPKNFYTIYFVKYPIILQPKPVNRNENQPKLQYPILERRAKLNSSQTSKKLMYSYTDKSSTIFVDDKQTPDTMSNIYIYTKSLGLNECDESAGILILEKNNYFDDIEITRIPEHFLNGQGHKLRGLKIMGRLLEKEYLLNGKSGSLLPEYMHELARQTYYEPSHLIFLTSKGIDLVIRLRPIDLLVNILRFNIDLSENLDFKIFISRYGVLETCTMLLQIICSKDKEYYICESWNNNEINDKSPIPLFSLKISEEIAQKASREFVNIGVRIPEYEIKQNISENLPTIIFAKPMIIEQRVFSSKTESLALYLSRVLRPIWNRRLINKMVLDGVLYEKLENFDGEELTLIRTRVSEIRNFFEKREDVLILKAEKNYSPNPNENQLKIETKPENKHPQPNANVLANEFVFEENKFLSNLYVFLDKTIQAFDILLFLLANRNFRSFILQMPILDQQLISKLRFQDMLCELDAELPIRNLLSSFLKKNINDFENLKNYFLQHFDMFFNVADSNIAKADYLLENGIKNGKKMNEINTALSIYIDNVDFLRTEKILLICNEILKKHNLYYESVKLCTLKLKNFLNNNEREEDILVKNNLLKEFILNTVIEISSTKKFLLNKKPLEFLSRNPDLIQNLSIEQLEKLYNDVLEEIMKTEDPDLIEKLISFLFRGKFIDDLFKIDSGLVETALLKESDSRFQDKYTHLYKFYIKNGDHRKAFSVAAKLALLDQTETKGNQGENMFQDFLIPENEVFPIKQRLLYLNFASQALDEAILELDHPYEKDYAVLIERKEDLKARIQNVELQGKVIERLKEINEELAIYILNQTNMVEKTVLEAKMEVEYSISLLNRGIMDLEKLNSNYIEKFNIWDCKILLLDFVENAPSNVTEIIGHYKKYILSIFEGTQNLDIWRPCLKKNLKSIYQSLNNKTRLFPLQKLIKLIEYYNQRHPQYAEFLNKGLFLRWQSQDPGENPFWLAEFLVCELDIPFFDIFDIYEKILFSIETEKIQKKILRNEKKENSEFNEFDSYDSEFHLFYFINLIMDLLDFMLGQIEKDRLNIISNSVDKFKIQASTLNLNIFISKTKNYDNIYKFCEKKLKELEISVTFNPDLIKLISFNLESILKEIAKMLYRIYEIHGFTKFETRDQFEFESSKRKENNETKIIPHTDTYKVNRSESKFIPIGEKTARPI